MKSHKTYLHVDAGILVPLAVFREGIHARGPDLPVEEQVPASVPQISIKLAPLRKLRMQVVCNQKEIIRSHSDLRQADRSRISTGRKMRKRVDEKMSILVGWSENQPLDDCSHKTAVDKDRGDYNDSFCMRWFEVPLKAASHANC